jgi:hypothetical protein
MNECQLLKEDLIRLVPLSQHVHEQFLFPHSTVTAGWKNCVGLLWKYALLFSLFRSSQYISWNLTFTSVLYYAVISSDAVSMETPVHRKLWLRLSAFYSCGVYLFLTLTISYQHFSFNKTKDIIFFLTTSCFQRNQVLISKKYPFLSFCRNMFPRLLYCNFHIIPTKNSSLRWSTKKRGAS